MPRYRLTLAYLGTAFAGWQRQPRERTVQGTVEDGLERLFGASVSVVGAGRTDAGVHAAAQVAHVDLAVRLPGPGLKAALNGVLPADVRIRSASRAADGFHALRDATGKRYTYRMRWSEPELPWAGLRQARVRPPRHWNAMEAAAALLVGRHDMASFTVPDHGRSGTRRTIHRCTLSRLPGGAALTVEGEGFLRYQVRRMVGALLEVGWGRHPVEWIHQLLEDPRPGSPMLTAPARGLTLERVYYRSRFPGSPPPRLR